MKKKVDLSASKKPSVIVVEASAGSGKTYALAKRYLQLILSSLPSPAHTPLKNILAITFTNKATVEMKERILDTLKKIALDVFTDKAEEKDILDFLGFEKKFSQKLAKETLNGIIRDYSSFQIQTIDSFINALLSGCAFNIERSANFKIKNNYNQCLAYCLDLVIEETATQKEALEFFQAFLDHYLFVENRRGWFPKEDILDLMQSLFKLSNMYGKLFDVCPGTSKDVIKKKKYIYHKIQDLAQMFPEGMNANSKKYINLFLERSDSIFDISSLPSVFRKTHPPMNKGSFALDSFLKAWVNIHRLIVELIELDASVAYNPYVMLFEDLLKFFQNTSRKEDLLFLEELNKKARLLFGGDGISVAEVYYRLATRLRHYLIDEFQDTSILQWRNLETMVEEALSTGGSLFYVGDKKQAIYRFRGGEVSLFDKVKHKYSHFNVNIAHLTKNWRSQKEIIEFNNKIFSKENLTLALDASGISKELKHDSKNIGEIIDIFQDSTQQHREENNNGYVYAEHIDEKNQEERDLIVKPKIINLIKELTERFRYQDIAILTRDNREVELITSWCLEAGFSVESEKTLNVLENSLIKEIISFLYFLYSPIDNLAFAGFILGKIFSKASRLPQDEIAEFIFRSHKSKKFKKGISLYHLFRNAYPNVWDKNISEFFKNVGFLPPYELTASIFSCLEIIENFPQNQAFFMKFLELLKKKEDDCTSLGEFLYYFENAPQEELYVNVTHSDSLKILTIHKSKGLEFPVVIIPFLRMDISPETGGRGTSSYVLAGQNDKISLIRITKNHRTYSKSLDRIYAESYKKACIDELNNMYVALTRSQHELYIFIPAKSGNQKNKACFVIPKSLYPKGKKISYNRKDRKQELIFKIPPLKPKHWLDLPKTEFTDISKVLNRKKIIEGIVLHAMFSKIGNCKDKNYKYFIDEALTLCKKQFPYLKDLDFYKKKAEQVLLEEKFKHLFYVPEANIYCEKEIVNKFGDLLRIDRLIVTKDEVLIVDYKNSQADKRKHKEQIIEYADIIKDIFPQRNLKMFLLYLDRMKLEQVKK